MRASIKLDCELVAEWAYRVGERLGIVAEGRKPKESQIASAEAEANAWLNEELTFREIDKELPI